jgi:hypothetical protein
MSKTPTANSPWPELENLDTEGRIMLMNNYCTRLEKAVAAISLIGIEGSQLEACNTAQKYLDRIRALLMSKPSNE